MDWRHPRSGDAGQARLDNAAPPEVDEDNPPLSEDDAKEEAEYAVTCSPASNWYHLHFECAQASEAPPRSVLFAPTFDAEVMSSDTLLIMLLRGDQKHAGAARRELCKRLDARMAEDIERETAELLANDAIGYARGEA